MFRPARSAARQGGARRLDFFDFSVYIAADEAVLRHMVRQRLVTLRVTVLPLSRSTSIVMRCSNVGRRRRSRRAATTDDAWEAPTQPPKSRRKTPSRRPATTT